MSAFICSALHIKTIAVHATEKSFNGYYPLINVAPKGEGIELSDATTVARILMAENIKSIDYRYPDNEGSYSAEYSIGSVTEQDRSRIDMIAFTPVELLKLIHCLNYQSCGHSTWQESLAYCILKAFERSLLRRLPGYDEAPWGLDDDYER